MCMFLGTKRFDSEKAGDREVQRTMLELLNQLDGFTSTSKIKVSRKPPKASLSFAVIIVLASRASGCLFGHPNP